MVKKYLSDKVSDIILNNFPEEGYPVQQHEEEFKNATELLLKARQTRNTNKKGELLDQAVNEIANSVLKPYASYTSVDQASLKPSREEAVEKAETIITQLSRKHTKSLELVKA